MQGDVHGRRPYCGFWRVLPAMAQALGPLDQAMGSGVA